MERISEEELQERIKEHHRKQKSRLEIEEAFILEERWQIDEEQLHDLNARSNLVLDRTDA